MNNLQQKPHNYLLKRILSFFVGCIACGILVLLSLYWRQVLYVLTPAPKPLMFVGFPELKSDPCDPNSFYITYNYAVENSVTEMQRYYENELAQYCITTSTFQESPYYCDSGSCLIATCELPPPPFSILQEEPYFVELRRELMVVLDKGSTNKTQIMQSQTIKTYINGKVDEICGE